MRAGEGPDWEARVPDGTKPVLTVPLVLRVTGLRLAFPGPHGPVEVLHGISLHVREGEKVALVGKSGSGKSTTARVVLGLMQDEGGAAVTGSVQLYGAREIVGAAIVHLPGARRSRGDDLPGRRIRRSTRHSPSAPSFAKCCGAATARLSNAKADERARAALADVHLHEPDRVLDSYVFQLSGGMSQRVMIALALANSPDLLVADEPGSSLDVTVQARTLRLDGRSDRGSAAPAVLFISHNLGVVREFADRVYVIYRGRIVEHATTRAAVRRSAPSLYARAVLGDPAPRPRPRLAGSSRGQPRIRRSADRPRGMRASRRAAS